MLSRCRRSMRKVRIYDMGQVKHNGRVYDSYEEFQANAYVHSYANKPNVTVAYASTKKINGVDTGVPCVVIGVESKVSLSDLSQDQLIPSVLPGGAITDVEIIPRIMSLTTCTGGGGGGCPPHDEKFRPLQGGISAIEVGASACTLGAVVQDSSDYNLVALTNNHCAGLLYDPLFKIPTFGNLTVDGIEMLQPSPSDGGVSPTDSYGTVKRGVAMQFGTTGGATNLVDCSISTIAIGEADYPILQLDDGPFPFAEKALYSTGQEVSKAGRTTGNTPLPTTTVTSKNGVVVVDYSGGAGGDNNLAAFTNQIICQAATRFGQGGDSGSAIVAFISGRWRIIGLHFAGDATGTYGVCCPIEEIASTLQVQAWDGSIVVEENVEENITVLGRQYRRVQDTSRPITHIASSSSSSSLSSSSSSSSSS